MINRQSISAALSPRLRYGLAGICVVLAFNSWLDGRDHYAQLEAEYQSVLKREARLRADLADPSLAASATKAKTRLGAAEARLEHADTLGQAQARAQDLLSDDLQRAGFTQFKVAVDAPEIVHDDKALAAAAAPATKAEEDTLPPDIRRVTVKVSAEFNETNLYKLLTAWSGRAPLTTVVSLKTHLPSWEAVVQVHYIVSETPAAATGSADTVKNAASQVTTRGERL
ncbi:MAG: hypothetical protein JO142_10040 [Burkholderiales bacterium]|nr:hypothetical protein [Burkholderiales bacterium]